MSTGSEGKVLSSVIEVGAVGVPPGSPLQACAPIPQLLGGLAAPVPQLPPLLQRTALGPAGAASLTPRELTARRADTEYQKLAPSPQGGPTL